MSVESPPPLRVEQLSKQFRQGASLVNALTEFDLTVHQGEFVAIMGASGSGKSTLLHLMAGLTRPDTGRVCVEGQELAKLSDAALTRFRRRRIGIVFQSLNLIPALNVDENISVPLQADNAPSEAYQKVDKIVERLGLSGRRTHRPGSLSGGEQQRVAIARALIPDPALILADEPTGNLDSVNSENICRILQQLNREDERAIVLVTHEPEVAMWADRIVILKDGELLSELATNDFSSPQSLATAYHELVGTTEQQVLTS
ncbi:ABC transporter ATP-binding protein [Thalassoglobus polymorphus]|uniref:ABC transporter ATP-binding protein YxdL n=1 Tax=Thalassoglobus polymorphus TaxID=2527994 RepID=A0A517QNA2_9PLAN|nr:ABC transporter ATP-binding protein [Thalassoglobus polymorphus]QDT33118.1 ABC transporter ATP-binding protein YxdL [Thalassoglobus polymorphus]